MTTPRDTLGPLDWAIAAAVVALGIVLMVENVLDDAVDASWLAIPAFLVVTVPILWRTTRPLATAVAVLVGLAVHSALFGDIVRCGAVMPIIFLLAFAGGARLDLREGLLGLLLTETILMTMTLADTQVAPGDGAFFVPIVAVVWGIGRLARARAQAGERLAARTEELKQTRDERARMEVELDRNRISAQLDALLHRRLGELAQLADAGARGDDPDTGATLAEIERRSRGTLQEMRAAVGVLRNQPAVDGAAAPQPTLTHLEALVLRAGTQARLQVEGSPRALPAGIELAAYRIVEHLLDALDGSPDVDVRVGFGPDALELAVSGRPGARTTSARAIERAHERVAVHSGTLSSAVRGGRSEVTASLPVALAGKALA